MRTYAALVTNPQTAMPNADTFRAKKLAATLPPQQQPQQQQQQNQQQSDDQDSDSDSDDSAQQGAPQPDGSNTDNTDDTDSDPSDDSNDGSGDGAQSDSDRDDGGDDGAGDPQATPADDRDDSEDSLDAPIDPRIQQALDDLANDLAALPNTTLHVDMINGTVGTSAPAEPTASPDKATWVDYASAMSSNIETVRSILLQYLSETETSMRQHGLRSGLVDVRRIGPLVNGTSDAVFCRRTLPGDTSVDIVMLLDISLSMRSHVGESAFSLIAEQERAWLLTSLQDLAVQQCLQQRSAKVDPRYAGVVRSNQCTL